MKDILAHIPEEQKQEIEKVTEIIKTSSCRYFGVEMIILFGSYARGDFVVRDVVSEGGGTRVYESDFDILIISNKPAQERNQRFLRQIHSLVEETESIEGHFNIIVEDIFHFNKMLEESRYFFLDIKNEGIVLFDTEKYKLEATKKLSNTRKKTIQKEDFDMWFQDAKTFFKHYRLDYENKDYRIGAFHLHQTTEKLMTAYLLVKTGYKPKTHDLEVIYRKIAEENESFVSLFNLQDETENHHFELLRKAYIEARYSKTYAINKKELDFLEEKIDILKKLVETLCQKEIQK